MNNEYLNEKEIDWFDEEIVKPSEEIEVVTEATTRAKHFDVLVVPDTKRMAGYHTDPYMKLLFTGNKYIRISLLDGGIIHHNNGHDEIDMNDNIAKELNDAMDKPATFKKYKDKGLTGWEAVCKDAQEAASNMGYTCTRLPKEHPDFTNYYDRDEDNKHDKKKFKAREQERLKQFKEEDAKKKKEEEAEKQRKKKEEEAEKWRKKQEEWSKPKTNR